VNRRGDPVLARCAVLFLDLLGVRAMNASPRVAAHLVALDRAVKGMHRDFLGEASRYRAAFFSDTLVLAAPITAETDDAAELDGLVEQAAWLQNDLVMQGFFARGGLSVGKLHIGDHVVFGPALVEAYELESRAAVHPRIVLSRRAAECQRTLPETPMLISDDDGRVFVHYLSAVFDAPFEDYGPLLERHRDVVVERLASHRGDKPRWEKYRWLAEYHNAVVRRALPKAPGLLVPAPAMTWRFKAFA
jgi:hypothetical protein